LISVGSAFTFSNNTAWWAGGPTGTGGNRNLKRGNEKPGSATGGGGMGRIKNKNKKGLLKRREKREKEKEKKEDKHTSTPRAKAQHAARPQRQVEGKRRWQTGEGRGTR
jgi:hypothetical protein